MMRTRHFVRSMAASIVATLATAGTSAHADPNRDWYNPWQGLYVGGLASYGVLPTKITTIQPSTSAGTASIGLDGPGGSILVGYRSPLRFWGSKVTVGVEVDGNFADNNGSSNGYRYHSDYFASARGLVGGNVLPDLFIFATGGISVLGVSTGSVATRTSSTTSSLILADPNADRSLLGATVGGGLEWETGFGFNIRADYLYTSLAGWKVTSTTTSAALVSTFHNRQIDTEDHLIRLGVVVPLYNPHDNDRYSRHREAPYK